MECSRAEQSSAEQSRADQVSQLLTAGRATCSDALLNHFILLHLVEEEEEEEEEEGVN